MFGMKDDFDSFKHSSLLGKLGYGAKLLLKGTANTVEFLAVEGSKKILENPNSTPEQRQKAKDFLDKHDR